MGFSTLVQINSLTILLQVITLELDLVVSAFKHAEEDPELHRTIYLVICIISPILRTLTFILELEKYYCRENIPSYF